MIIWGWRAITRNGESGQFNCPNCNVRRPYQRKKIQRFFTLYFIPIIPLQVLQESIECQVCKKRYVPEVLTHDPAAEAEARRAAINEAFRGVLLHFAGMADRRDADFMRSVVGIYAGFEGGTITADEVRREIDPPRLNAEPETAKLRPFLSDRGRESVVEAALSAATADGELTEAKRTALGELADGLGMTPIHLQGVLASWSPPPALAAGGTVH